MADKNPMISCVQWRMRALSGLGKLLGEIEKHVREQAEQGADLVMFPELFSLGLLDPRKDRQVAMNELARHSPSITDYCAELAKKHRVNILAGSLPRREYGRLFNVATFCHRDGRPSEFQCKLHPTPYEREQWDTQGGEDLHAFDTDIGRCGVLVCYDVEFPELPRLLREQDVDLLLVPYWTDSLNAYHRVRFCARARAVENECYVAMAGSFGEVAGNDVIDFQYAQSAVFSPSDSVFPEQAILAEAPANTETSVIAELDFGKLELLRRNGTVQTGGDRRRDLYQIAWHGKPHMQFTPLVGRQISPYLRELAQLRIKVFRDFPYLYDGNLEYEKKYLQSYIKSSRSLVFLIREGGRTVGATTALPLVDADPDFHAPFVRQGVPLEDVYYFGESVLLPEYRGRGYGHRFFDEREARAKQLGFSITTFCVVVRDERHPARPKDFSSFAGFWKKRGYKLAEGFTCNYHWKDVGDAEETEKVMQFWIKKN